MAEQHATYGADGGHVTEPSTGELVTRLTQEVSELVRDELRLAQVEMSAKAKRAGVGAGLFGTAGIVALFGVGALVTTAILALALVVDAWLAALIVAVALLIIAGIAAMLGRREVAEATPPMPEETIASVRRDIEAAKGSHR